MSTAAKGPAHHDPSDIHHVSGSIAENVSVTDDHRPRRNQLVPGWVDRAWARAADATDGIVWIIAVCLFMSGIGFVFAPIDLHDRNQARALQADGEWVTAQDVEVHVHRVRGKGGGYSEVDKVRVRLADDPNNVELDNVNATADSVPDDVAEGWQAPTPVTQYEPPLDVRVQRDADGTVITAMAKDDYEYWTQDNSDPEIGLMLGVSGLLAAVAFLGLNSVRLAWQTRRGRFRRDQHQAEHEARVAVTGKRGRR